MTKTADTNDGVCDADCSLREAIIQSNKHAGVDTTVLPAGEYVLSIDGTDEYDSARGDLNINDGLILIGSGMETTVIQGSGSDRVLTVDTFSRRISVQISGLTIQQGSAIHGAGILNNADLTLNNVSVDGCSATNGGGISSTHVLRMNDCSVTNNLARSSGLETDGFGGGIFIASGSLVLKNSTFLYNQSRRNGGAIYTATTAPVEFYDSRFERNTATGSGGAVTVNYTAAITGCTFLENQANDGGAISSYDLSTVSIIDSTFERNAANGLDLGGGGALFNFLGVVDIKTSVFRENTAYGEGGGAIENTGVLTVANSRFLSNQAFPHDASQFDDHNAAPGFGGAVLLISGAAATFEDAVFTSNTAGNSGGAVYNDQNSTLTLEYCTLASNTATTLYGGAIYNEGNLAVNYCTLSGNQAEKLGGALATRVGEASVVNSTLDKNTSLINGGAVYNGVDSKFLIIKKSIISDNTAKQYGGAILNESVLTLETSTIDGNNARKSGGALYNAGQAKQANIRDCTLTNNIAGINGGAVWNDSDMEITTSVISHNTAADQVGGIGNSGGTLGVFHCRINANKATSAGGIGNFSGSSLNIENSTLYENTADEYGGGILNSQSALTLENATLTMNHANIGGSISNNDAQALATLNHVTVAGNSATVTAAEILNYRGRLTFTNSMISGECNNQGTIVSNGGNYESLSDTCSLNHSTDAAGMPYPLSSSLQNNGGDTPTLGLSAASPAISNGNTALCLELDQRGQSRISCDSGAYTSGPDTFLDAAMRFDLVLDSDGNNAVNHGDTLEFAVTITNIGNNAAKDVVFEDLMDKGLDLVAGSVTATQGNVLYGNGTDHEKVRVEAGTLGASENNEITYRAVVHDKSNTTLYNQGMAFAANAAKVLTDNKDTTALNDATAIIVEKTADAQAFVARLFENILSRSADESGINYWMRELKNNSAAFVLLGFFNSSEFEGMSLTDEEFVDLLYNTMYGRPADSAGLSYWQGQLANHLTRDVVIFNFLYAEEFARLADGYDVVAVPAGVEGFVMRFYSLVLGRADKDGLSYWSQLIASGAQTSSGVAAGFFSSNEYQDMNHADAVFINTAYAAFFGRIADDGGRDYWQNKIDQGWTRSEIVDAFIESGEFATIVANFGL